MKTADGYDYYPGMTLYTAEWDRICERWQFIEHDERAHEVIIARRFLKKKRALMAAVGQLIRDGNEITRRADLAFNLYDKIESDELNERHEG